MKKYLSFMTSFQGRVGRMQYFGSSLALLLVLLPLLLPLVGVGIVLNLSGVPQLVVNGILGVIYLIVAALYLIAEFSFIARRAHDIGWSGWTSLIALIPLVNIIYGLFLLFAKGSAQENTYGPSIIGKGKGPARFCDMCGVATIFLFLLVLVLPLVIIFTTTIFSLQ